MKEAYCLSMNKDCGDANTVVVKSLDHAFLEIRSRGCPLKVHFEEVFEDGVGKDIDLANYIVGRELLGEMSVPQDFTYSFSDLSSPAKVFLDTYFTFVRHFRGGKKPSTSDTSV